MNPYKTLRSVIRLGRVETDPVERRLARAASVADLRGMAKRRLPGGVFDYIDGAAEDERTLAANQDAFARVTFHPRVLRGVEKVDIATTMLGRPLAYPLVLAPTGFTRIADPEGELAVARAARRAQLPYTLSTLSTRSIEEVRAVSDGRLWFQVYAWRDRGLVKEMVAPVADVVGGRTEVICDGGVRRGSDIVKALAAGASAVMAGRAYLYGLGAAGERGVDRVLGWFASDMVRTMSLLGAASISDLNRELVDLSGLQGSE